MDRDERYLENFVCGIKTTGELNTYGSSVQVIFLCKLCHFSLKQSIYQRFYIDRIYETLHPKGIKPVKLDVLSSASGKNFQIKESSCSCNILEQRFIYEIEIVSYLCFKVDASGHPQAFENYLFS